MALIPNPFALALHPTAPPPRNGPLSRAKRLVNPDHTGDIAAAALDSSTILLARWLRAHIREHRLPELWRGAILWDVEQNGISPLRMEIRDTSDGRHAPRWKGMQEIADLGTFVAGQTIHEPETGAIAHVDGAANIPWHRVVAGQAKPPKALLEHHVWLASRIFHGGSSAHAILPLIAFLDGILGDTNTTDSPLKSIQPSF